MHLNTLLEVMESPTPPKTPSTIIIGTPRDVQSPAESCESSTGERLDSRTLLSAAAMPSSRRTPTGSVRPVPIVQVQEPAPTPAPKSEERPVAPSAVAVDPREVRGASAAVGLDSVPLVGREFHVSPLDVTRASLIDSPGLAAQQALLARRGSELRENAGALAPRRAVGQQVSRRDSDPSRSQRKRPGASANHQLFRERALLARDEADLPVSLPRVSGSRWAVLLLLCSLAAVLFGIAYFGHVEVTSKALGALRVAAGPRPITAQTSGVVSRLSVKAGDRVDADQALVRIEARELSAKVEKSARQLKLLRDQGEEAKKASSALHERTLGALHHEHGLLLKRAALKQQQVEAHRGHAFRVRELREMGAASEIEAIRAEESASAAQEELLGLRQQAARIGVEIADRKQAFGSREVEREFRVREAEVGLAEAETLAVLGNVTAPEAGRVESLLVSEGQVVQAGVVLARIVPDGQASHVVVFAPAKDAAFLREGLSANLEFPSLPVSEYGKADARVTRVASDLALSAEVQEVLGTGPEESGGLVRVELELVDDAAWRKMAPRLHSGARVIARLQTRKRRIITLLFDFLRSWYPE